MRILILGGNGFIGSAVARMLVDRGHYVTAVAREASVASRQLPEADWIRADISRLQTAEQWKPLLAGIEAVVNCAGALQDGARDDVNALQYAAMAALWQAADAASIKLVVQISADTDGGAVTTPFFSTKRRADAALKSSGVPYVILRPAIVVGRNAHGGSALLRALAAVPAFTPLAHAESPMRFAALADVAEFVVAAVEARIAPGADLHIAADETLTLGNAVAVHRAWLGLPPARSVAVPRLAANAIAWTADALGQLGWRSPLRSTAVTVAAGGVGSSGMDATAPDGERLLTLREALAASPAGVQDRWFARLYLLKPLVFATLSLFWILSGVIALLRFDVSSALVVAAGAPPPLAAGVTLATSLADIALGVGVAIRRHSAAALKGMVALALGYLFAATIFSPALWADPLGPLVKVLPSIVLALVALAVLDER